VKPSPWSTSTKFVTLPPTEYDYSVSAVIRDGQWNNNDIVTSGNKNLLSQETKALALLLGKVGQIQSESTTQKKTEHLK